MDNDKKLFEELLKADGISPASVTEQERLAFAKMLDQQLEQKQSKPTSRSNIWKIIMKNKITKFAAAAVVIVATIIGINQFDRGSVAFGDIIYKIVVAETATFDLILEKEGQVIQTSHFTCKAPGLIKQMMPDGVTNIVDFEKHRLLILNFNTKKAMLRDLEQDSAMSKLDVFSNFQKLLEKMIHFQDETVENLGYKIIDDKEVVGFRIQLTQLDKIIGWQGKGTFTVWADTATKLPIRLEWYDEMFGVNTIADKLELNVELDESTFEMNVPDGFELETVTQKVEKGQAPGNQTNIDEKKIIDGFRGWVLLSDGAFPSSMTMDAIKDLDPNATMTFKQVGWGFQLTPHNLTINSKKSFGFSKDNPLSQEQKEAIMEKIQVALNNALGGFIAVFKLPADSDWHYAGQGVTMDDTDTPIFWYKPADSPSYRVIYGDLTVEDVMLEDLPE